jgi:protein gp37
VKNIEWATKTWNPLTGCKNGCTWKTPDGKVVGCYAKAISDRFHLQEDFCEPVIHQDRMLQPFFWTKPQRIFVCSMADLFGDWVSAEFVEMVLHTIRGNPRHTFLLLTKNPKRLHEFTFPDNAHVGVTVDGLHLFSQVPFYKAKVRWISYEPLTKDTHRNPVRGEIGGFYNWVVIGALSAGAKKYQPEREWVEHILTAAEGLPVFMKDNLDCEALGITRRQELPA